MNKANLPAAVATGLDGPVRLTPTEWRSIALLLATPGRVVTEDQIVGEVGGPGREGNSHHLRVYASGLCHKLEADPSRRCHLITEPGLGCRHGP
ncbi:winged helix-turn-helix domain-containing protein [Kitasatospora sp. NBC_00070]|uniref:winged helix-turn-helix domain-containing protein n=1 Tax=Kitasatospora sp. NBC_00070 TaxID=2975962 RepID=UPI003860139A